MDKLLSLKQIDYHVDNVDLLLVQLRSKRFKVTDKQSSDSMETAQEVFGLPDMTTSYDDLHVVAYSLDISGNDGWKARINVYESYPLNKGPVRFVPSLDPKRLFKVTDATLRIDMRVSAFQEAPWTSIQCPSVNDLGSALKKYGWGEMALSQPLDGGIAATGFRYGHKAVFLNAECSKLVPENIVLSQEPVKS